MNPDAVYWQQPTAIEVWTHDKRHYEIMFESRQRAEEYMSMIALAQLTGDAEGTCIHRAIIRPLGLGVN